MLPGSREDMVLRSGEEVRGPRQKSPQVERREARVLSRTEHAAPLKGARPRRCAKPALPSLFGGRRKEKAAPRARLLQGPMSHVCIGDADVMR